MDFPGFVEEFNWAFCSRFGAAWHGKVDAFNDYRRWLEARYELRWKHSIGGHETVDLRLE